MVNKNFGAENLYFIIHTSYFIAHNLYFISHIIFMSKTIIQSNHAPAPIGPYSQAVLAGGTLYVSGQIAIDPISGNLITTDVASETHQVLKNLQAILHAADMDFDNVVKCTIFIRNMGDFQTINGIYGQYFEKNYPARETVEVSRLPKDVNVEISCIAVR